MKKTVVLIAALLSCFLAYSQEANDAGLSGELQIVPRFEFNPYVYTHGGGFEYDFGSSGLWTLFEGDLGDHVSLSISNLWVNQYPKYLYSNTFDPKFLTWVNWAYVNVHYNNFFANLGKQSVKIGTFEFDEYDHNSYWGLNSLTWNTFQVYQWGAAVGWRTEDESTELGAQITSGISGRWPFQDGITANVYAYKELSENSKAMASLTYFKQGLKPTLNGDYTHFRYFMLSAGYQRTFGDATATIDGNFYNKWGSFNTSITASFKYDFEKLDLTAKVGFDHCADESDTFSTFLIGGLLQYYPLRHSDDLRLHLLTAYNNVPGYSDDNYFNFTVGVTYFFNLKLY